jgi:predicted RNA-binding Zn ribbon-like protein
MNFVSHAERVAAVSVALVNALTPGRERGHDVPRLDGDEVRARASAVVGHPVDPRDADGLALAARRIRPVFDAVERGDVDGAAGLVNGLIRTYRPSPLLARHDGEPWHLHFHGTRGGTVHGWAAGCVAALAYVLGSPGRERLGVCSADACDRVFIDTSRNGMRRFCGTACQSRTKAAAFRARRRA